MIGMAIARRGLALMAGLLCMLLAAGCGDRLTPVGPWSESGDDGDWITLRVELFDRNDSPPGAPPITDNFMTRYIQEQFGDPNRIKVEFVTIPRAEEVERLDVLLAANQAPDLVFTYDIPLFYKYASQGKLTDLTPYLAEHGRDLERVLGEEVLSEGRVDGRQFAIPARRVLRAHNTSVIREDWLRMLGLPLPETTEQFYETLVVIKTELPDLLGYDVIPWGQFGFYHTVNVRYAFWDWSRITEEDFYAKPSWIMPGNKEAFRFLNRLYNEGLLRRDFALDQFSQQFRKDLVNGRVAGGTTNTNEPVYMGYLADLQARDPDAILTPIDPFTGRDGRKRKPLLEKTGMYIMVPAHSKNAEAAVKNLNWMAQPEHYTTLQNGIPGVTYELKDGLPVMLDNEETKRMLYNYFDYCIILNGKFVSAEDMALNVRANTVSDPRYESFTQKCIEYALNDTVEMPKIEAILESEIKYGSLLREKDDEMFVKVVTAPPDEFDAVYDEEVAAYMRMGGQQVMEEKRTAFRRHAR
jgi:putative aldouronate transport system substrate-binding protein